MLPHIHLGIFHIPSYSLLVLIGMIAFTVSTIHILEKRERTEVKVTNRLLIISAFGFIFLAISALIFNSIFHSIKNGRIVIGGITWLGGVIGAFPITILIIRKFCPNAKGEALRYFGYLIPGLTLAHGFGRVGCFLGGCCYGRPTNDFWGVCFPSGSPAATQYPSPSGSSLPVLPTQLYEAVFEFLLFATMMLCYKILRHRFLEMYCIGYGTFRFFLEFFRGDDRGALGVLSSPSQIISILLISGGIAICLYKKRSASYDQPKSHHSNE